jgi:translation initiation factor 2B subunit (eIF-2B alpha/beta/delta family)
MEIVREVETDRSRGATALAERALDALASSRKAAPALLRARPSMPLVAALVRRALRSGVPPVRRALAEAQARLLERAEEILPREGRFWTFGSSGTVEAVVRALRGRPGQGRGADVALVGADALLPNGDIVNAAGTADFVRRARADRCGAFVVALELKRVDEAPPLERGFERVDGKLVHAVLTETGLRYPPLAAVAGVDPTWMDRGALNPHGGRGRCHPHHGPR